MPGGIKKDVLLEDLVTKAPCPVTQGTRLVVLRGPAPGTSGVGGGLSPRPHIRRFKDRQVESHTEHVLIRVIQQDPGSSSHISAVSETKYLPGTWHTMAREQSPAQPHSLGPLGPALAPCRPALGHSGCSSHSGMNDWLEIK